MKDNNHFEEQVKVSVITLTFNDFRSIFKTIDSIFLQKKTFTGYIEYIIADDGTDNLSDDFFRKIEKYIANKNSSDVHLKAVYSNGVNIGTVRSLNKAVSLSSGEIIVPLSCGDYFYDESSINKIVKMFCDTNFEIVTSYRYIVKSGAVVKKLPYRYQAKELKKKDELLKYLAVYGNFISGASTYYKRSFICEMGGFDESYRLMEDYPIYLKALCLKCKIGFIDDVLMCHELGGISTEEGKMNPHLKKDIEKVKFWIKSDVDMGLCEKRRFHYFQEMTFFDKVKPINILKYFDCFLLRLFYLFRS